MDTRWRSGPERIEEGGEADAGLGQLLLDGGGGGARLFLSPRRYAQSLVFRFPQSRLWLATELSGGLTYQELAVNGCVELSPCGDCEDTLPDKLTAALFRQSLRRRHLNRCKFVTQ